MTPAGVPIPLQILNKPDFTSNDGAQTSVPGFQPFFGTSAAAPNAAAVAALLLGVNPTLTPAQIRSALLNGAIDINTPGYDLATGNGLIDATNSLLSFTGGVLTINGDVPAANQNDDIRLRANAGDPTMLDVTINGTTLTSIRMQLINSIQVNGLGGDDVLTVDLGNGDIIPSGGISFAGGETAETNGDAMIVKGYSLNTADGIADVTVNHIGPEAGNVVLQGFGVANFSEIEPLALLGTAADLVINLPAGPNTDVMIGDDTNANFPGLGLNLANKSAIDASTFEYTSFTNPTNSLTVNLNNGGDTATLRAMDAAFAPAGAAVAVPFFVRGGSGADTVNVQATTVRTRVYVGGGADTINVSSNAPLNTGDLNAIDAILETESGDNNPGDIQNISEFGNGAGDTVRVDGFVNTVTYSGTAGGGWRIDGISSIFPAGTIISTGSGVDTFNVVSAWFLEPVTINSGGGNDVFNVSSNAPTNTGNLNLLDSLLTINGQAGSNQLTVSNSGNAVADTVAITSNSITGTTGGGYSINYSATGGTFANGVRFDGGSGGNTISVTSTLAGAPTTVNSGSGIDTVNVTATNATGPLAINAGSGLDIINIGNTGTVTTPGFLTPIAGAVTVDGGVGGANLTVDGSGAGVAADYDITSTKVSRSLPAGFGGVTYSNLSNLLVTVGNGVNIVTVPSTSVPTTVNTNGGADVVTIGNGTLDNIAAAVTVSGGNGTPDQLIIDDSANTTVNLYTITPTTVTRFGGPSITYDATVESLTVRGGTKADTFSVLPSADTSIQIIDSTMTNLIVNLPSGPSAATLADNGTLGDNTSKLTGTTFQPVVFSNPSTLLTVNRGNAADTVAVNSIPDFISSLTLGSSVSPLGGVTMPGTVGLTAGNINVFANTINVSSTAIATGGGNVSFNGDTTFVLGSVLTTGAGTFTNNGAFNGTGTITTNGVKTVNNTDAGSTFAGTLSGNGGLIKNGVGTVSLTGASNYTGPTTVNDGRLLVNGSIGSIAFPTNTTVNSPGLLGGAGVINGNVNGNGVFAPGNSPGVLTINGNFNPTGTVVFEVNPPAAVAGTDFDQFIVNGVLDLSGATLSFSGAAGAVAAGTIVRIVDNDLSEVSAAALSHAQGSAVVINGNTYILKYNGGTGNDVILEVVTVSVLANDTFVQEDPSAAPFPNNGQFKLSLSTASGPISLPTATFVTYTLTGQANLFGTVGIESGDDYKAQVASTAITATGTLTIPATTTQLVVDIDVIDDLLFDGGNESVNLTLTGSPSISLGKAADTMNIVDNELAPTISITATDSTATENVGGTDPGQFTVTMSGASDTNTVVALNYAAGNPATVAVNGLDYSALASVTIAKGTTFQAGATSSTTTVAVIDDALVEGSETVTASLGLITGNTGIINKAPTSAVVTIFDDPDTSLISIGGFSAATVSEPTGVATAVISMTKAASTNTVVKFALFTGTTAIEGTDYTLGELNEIESNNTATGPQPLGDGPQGLAGFSLASKANIAVSTSTPHVTINSLVGSNVALNADVYSFYTSTGGAAIFDIDNAGAFNSFLELLDASGNVLAFNDNFFEGVGIGSGAGPSTTDSQISFTLPSAGVYMIRVSASILPASANSALTGSSSGGVPIGSAYQLHLSVPGSSGFAVIGAGSTTVPLTVTVIDDLLVEPTEIINVRLDSITSADPDISFLNASPADASRNATVSILDNDVAKVSASSTNALEPTTSGVYTFTQTLLSATDTVIKLVIDGSSTTKDSVNGTVNDPADHSLAQTVTVTIGAGSTQATLTVPIIDSLLIEQDETLVLNMTLIGTTDPDITINTVANPGSKALMLFGDEDSGVVAVDATFAPAVEGGAIGKFTFFLSEISPLFTKGYPFSPLTKSDRDVVIEYTIGGTAINGVDYDFLTGTATIPAFSSTVTILVDATGAFDDMLLEGPETVSVTITKLLTPTDSNIDIDLGSPADSLVINDNDALTVKIASTQNTTEGGALGKFVFSTSGVGTTAVPTVVTYQVKAASSTAVQGVDFASLSGTATIPAGAASQTVAINIDATGVFNDSLFEGTETVTIEILTVSGGPGVVVDPIAKQDTGLIFDDETGQVTIAKTLDAAEGFSNGLFTVSLGGQSPLPTVVKLEVVPAGVNNATSGVDYTAIGGPFTTITFNPFQTQVTVPVNVIDDGISELTESVIVRVNSVLSGAYTPNVSPATVLIFSDQVVSITASLPAASEPSTNGEFVLSLSTPGFAGATTSSLPTVVTFTIAAGAGQASNGTDYKSLALSATIPANASTVAIPVSVLNDLTLEGNETVTLTLTSISSGNGDITVNAGSKVATVTISDDDSAYLTVATTKGPGQDNLASDVDGAFTITMSNPSDQNTVVKFSIAGTATSGTDFTSIPLSATILANQTQVLIPVDVLNDNIVEGTETVVIKLQSPTTSPYAAKIFLGAIGSTFLSDGLATVSFRDGVNGYIGTTDTSLDQFAPAVNRGLDTVLSVSVDTGLLNERDGLLKFDGIVGTTNGLIPSGTKLVNATVELLTTAGNVVVYQLLLPFNELVDTWSNSFGANGVQPNGFEAANIGTPAVTGGPISISSPLLLSTIQSWINGGTNNGLALLSPNSFLFNSSEDVTIANRPRLTATLDLSATLDIIDTDTATVSVIGSNAASEPGTNGSLVIGLSSKASTDVVVFFNDVLSGTAISGSDYVAIPAGSVTIFAGSTTATIAVVPNNDSLVEAPETVNLVISKITVTDPEITLGSPATGTVIINDNDFALVSITSTTDGDENGVPTPILGAPINGSFTISMSTPSSVDTVVSLSIGGTATSGSDYTAIPLSVTIPANFLSTTIPVAVIDDLINEAPIETVTLSLTGVTSGLLTQTFVGAPSSATVNIADDEQPLTVNNVATKATATEGGPNGEFQFQLNFPSDNPTTITYKFLGTSTATPAINGTSPDFNASALTGSTGPLFTTGTVVIPTGSTTVALPVNAYQDFIAEIGGETVNLQITSISNNNPSGIGIASTTVTIQDVVYIVSVLKTDSPAAEPGPPAGSNGQFTFSLTAPLPEPTVVTYSIGGTATPSTPVQYYRLRRTMSV